MTLRHAAVIVGNSTPSLGALTIDGGSALPGVVVEGVKEVK